MSKKLLILTFLLATARAAFSSSEANPAKWDQNSRQLIVVTTDGWNQAAALVHRYERESAQGRWKAVGSRVAAVVGRRGLAWGRGLHPTDLAGPQKIEGDGKSPAGAFALASAFGFAPAEEMKGLKLPYLHVTDAIECVDDVKSQRYNSIVDNSHIIDRDWNSSEQMLAIGEQYRLGVMVEHNAAPRMTGKGSCIFLHVWKGDGSGTSGCTAMSRRDLEQLVRWLDAKAKPVLVQLPEAELLQKKKAWRLPEFRMDSHNK